MQLKISCVHELIKTEVFLWGSYKKQFMYDLKNRITTAVNSVTQDILLLVWNEFSYHLDVIRAAGGGHIEHL
jgi:hypothetical protein